MNHDELIAALDQMEARAETAERERDEARAALVRLRAAAAFFWGHAQNGTSMDTAQFYGKSLCDALAATPADHDPAVRLPVLPATCGACEHWDCDDGCHRCGDIPCEVLMDEPTQRHASPPTWCPLRQKEG